MIETLGTLEFKSAIIEFKCFKAPQPSDEHHYLAKPQIAKRSYETRNVQYHCTCSSTTSTSLVSRKQMGNCRLSTRKWQSSSRLIG